MKTLTTPLTTLIILFASIVSPVFGGVGDVYYCDTKMVVTVYENEMPKKYLDYKFKFKWEEDLIIFDEGNHYLSGRTIPYVSYTSNITFNKIPGDEHFNFVAPNLEQAFIFNGKNLMFTAHTFDVEGSNTAKWYQLIIRAHCEKF